MLEGNVPSPVSVDEKRESIMIHLRGVVDFMGDTAACREMRKHVCAYLKGIPNSAKVRQAVTTALTVQEYEGALSQLK